ncbi:GDP-mannose 4,6-dehydratase [Paenibacillus allorhizosphaerae]|uniref:GDP-6-deoxy-D-mannose reductase n=1 Tax=Paenibacillus allorhizosphaerae TaxID=2849866 RepID=A0ABM8VV03_9BACL|nr:GDP-mannose 4,6-dehydratase [Paenibacillus allorhizosphaerae]CAG7659141.1 GDP-6-deoxy-D-mannose reductase [Paenibacillus allorhizosphaerae]
MRALITGATGFVAKHLTKHLTNLGFEVWGTTRKSSPVLFKGIHHIQTLDLNTSIEQIVSYLNFLKPDYIFHLAGQSSVKKSWDNKIETFEANVVMTINLLEAVRGSIVAESVKILTVGSSEEYGEVNLENMPISEKNPLRPISPYGISKATVSMLAEQYHRSYSLNIVHVRPFNHIGPGQDVGFVTSDFAKQIAEIEEGKQTPIIKVGNLDAKRDFTDVRDIVQAYALLVAHGQSGKIYNVCSKKPTSIQEILEKLINLSRCQNIEIHRDLSKMRPSDFPYYYGDSSEISLHTGWSPKMSIDDSLKDILDHWRLRLKSDSI